jgi:hypothetical protein
MSEKPALTHRGKKWRLGSTGDCQAREMDRPMVDEVKRREGKREKTAV